jgi:deoxyribodipyrimidine photo-lyase
VLPVFCFDPRQFQQTDYGFAKTGAYRASFLLASVSALRDALDGLGGGLLVCVGHPETTLPRLCEKYNCQHLHYTAEVTEEEQKVEQALEEALLDLSIEVTPCWDRTLYDIDDLPMSIHDIPEVFTTFRKKIEATISWREPFPAPTHLSTPSVADWGTIPSLQEWGLEPPQPHPNAILSFQGGEQPALARLHHYFWEERCLHHYKETRNGLHQANDSSKFSPWLALGCLSPREVAKQVREYESKIRKNTSTYWLIFELLWRDFFRFRAMQIGNALFHFDRQTKRVVLTPREQERLHAWVEGQTGVPFIDANMRELKETGWMSNRGRQNVASFLVHDLAVPWLAGAAYFESQLIDYDVCSNYGNWQYVAGVGADPRKDRYFNVLGQGLRYDPKSIYIRRWVPEVDPLGEAGAHVPFFLRKEAREAGVQLGHAYPFPVVLPKAFQRYHPTRR